MQVGQGEPAAVGEHHRDAGGQRQQGPDPDPVRAGVRAEHGMRVVVQASDDPVDLARVHLGHLPCGAGLMSTGIRGTGDRAGLAAPGHAAPSAIEPSGMGSQDGRFLASYITS